MADRKQNRVVLYALTCIENNKVYIGVASWFAQRKGKHFNDLSKGIHANTFLQEDYDKYGEDKFIIDQLELFNNKHEAERIEKFYTECVLGRDKSVCYNILQGGANVAFGMRKRYKQLLMEDAAFRGKISEMMSLRHSGKIVSTETREKLRVKAIGRKASQETKEKFSLNRRGHLNYKAKKVIDTQTGKVYDCLKYAAIDLNINYDTLRARINGYNSLKTTLKWL